MKKLGQHFLKNTAVLETIVDALALGDGDRVIEIGPGHGELTTPLLRAAKKFDDTSVTVIEKDHELIAGLTTLGEKESVADISVVEGDALTLLPGIVSGPDAEKDHRKDGHGASKPYKIVGNIPYYITGKLLRVISELDQKPVRAVLMVQKEVAERICAVSPEMNRLAASVQFWADARIIAIVPKKDFSPPPEVDSAVIVLETKKWALDGTPAHGSAAHIDPELYYRAVRGIFAQPRKTLLNNIMAIDNALNEKNDKNGPDDKPKMSHGKEVVAARLMECGIDPAARPQDLDIAQITLIANTLLGEIWG